ncbi:Saccharopine dehydrogenase / Homospermidine synthase [Penicillium italicum]|uniref:Saccharopine dehydrogenase / Homospermidine synthase n=1 Tax=Penicillium italicum TaxID=40296 RepID=A0A0A2KAA2_PENIT|nr:Saccharopine dehydrogenase / Homospermidine synthase [Penicillium italicum]
MWFTPSMDALTANYKSTTAIALDVVNDPENLCAAISQTDIVISLIPYVHHALVVSAAIKYNKPVVTTSYISPALWALDDQAKAAGITVLNEIGLDPGIDHFTPSPGVLEDVSLPFSTPHNSNRDNKIATVDGKNLIAAASPQHIFPGFNLVGYPNRDSVGFRDFYNIPEAHTVFRGTLRYAGFPEIIRALVAIRYFSQERVAVLERSGTTWVQLTSSLLGLSESSSPNEVENAVRQKIEAFVTDKDDVDRALSGLRWIGLFDPTPVGGYGTPLDTLCAVLETRMAYQPRERDMIVLQHIFDIKHADGLVEKRSSTLVEYGEPLGPGYRSSMAKLVGLPCAVGVLAVLEGRIPTTGMVAPWSSAEIASLLRGELKEKFGIELKERVMT